MLTAYSVTRGDMREAIQASQMTGEFYRGSYTGLITACLTCSQIEPLKTSLTFPET
jgi:hypothetical protein